MATTNIEPSDPDYVRPEIIQSYLDKFQRAAASNAALVRHTNDSLNWFRKRISKDLRLNRHRLIRDSGDYKRRTGRENKTLVGRLYYFEYEAVEAGDRENNVYDRFPMVFIFNTSVTNDGRKLIHALNMHYLQPKERAFLYLKLMKIRNKKNWNNATKLKISWEVIKTLVSHHIYQKAVHTYRVDRLQSKLIEIHAYDWEVATFLRLEQWIHVEGHAVRQKDIRASRRKKK
jgi:hypothetical protein